MYHNFLKLFFILAILFSATSFASAKEGSSELEDFDFIKNLFNDQRYQYVHDEGSKYLKQYPKGVFKDQVNFYLAQIETRQHTYASAIHRYQNIIQNFPNSRYTEDSLYYLGILLIENKQESKGVKILNQLNQKFPSSSYIEKVSFVLGQLAFKNKNWTPAETWFLKTIKSKNALPEQKLEARRYLAWIYYFQGKKKSAHKWFVILLNINISTAHKAEISYQMALDQQKAGKLKKAIFWYKRQLNEFPDKRYQDHSRFWVSELTFQTYKNNLAKLSVKKQNKLIQAYTKNLSLKTPINAEVALYHRALLYYHQKNIVSAEQDFKKLQKKYPIYNRDRDLTLIRADINFKLKRWAESLKLVHHLLKIDPKKKSDHLILLNIAKIHETLSLDPNLKKLRKKYREIKTQAFHQRQSLHFYKKAYKVFPLGDKKGALALIDLIIDKLKSYSENQQIIFYYKEALQLLENKEEKENLQFTIATTYLKLNDPQNAKQWFARLHKKGGRSIHFEASYLLGEIYIEEQNYSKAIKILTSVSKTSLPSSWYFEINYRLAEIFHFQENWKKAVQYYKVVSNAPVSFAKQKEAADHMKQILNYLKSVKNSEVK